MLNQMSRREFLIKLGFSPAAALFLMNLPSLTWAATPSRRKRLVFVFSPNGVIPKHFWPDKQGTEFELKRILQPLQPFKHQLLTLQGVDNKIKGDGDGHMRGIGCLLTGIELFPGDIQGGSDTPAGWSMGISIDQHVKNKLQADPATQTRFGSLEFGVMVPDRADTWTRMSYAGPNQPVAPISDPYQMFDKLYGQTKNRQLLASVLDELSEDFKKVQKMVSSEDRRILDEHLEMVRAVEVELKAELAHKEEEQAAGHLVPKLPPNIDEENDNMPQLSRMQIELLVNSFAADFARIASFQITQSVGGAKMRWLDIKEGHHQLSHEPDSSEVAYEKLIKINTWYCEQVAHLAKRLSEIPEPGGEAFVFVGGGLGLKMGRAVKENRVPHNRLLLSISEAMGYPEKTFGNPDYCGDGPLTGLS